MIGGSGLHAERSDPSRQMRPTRTLAPVMPARYVRIHLFEALTGYSAKAVERKIESGVWIEGQEFKKAPDGHVLIDMKGYERWVDGHQPAE